MRRYLLILPVFCSFQYCYGQLSNEEAQRRMEDLNRRAPAQTAEKTVPVQAKRVKVWRAKDDAPRFIKVWAAHLDELRAWEIDGIKKYVDAEKSRLSEIQRRPIPTVAIRDGFLTQYVPDAAARQQRAEDVRASEKRIADLWKRIHDLESFSYLPVPQLPWRIGGFGLCNGECSVLQIVNPTNFLLEFEQTVVWVEGKVPGLELAGDGGNFFLNSFVMIKGVKTYTTVRNLENRVPHLVIVDYSSHFEQVEVDLTDAAARAKNAKAISPASLALLVQAGSEGDTASADNDEPLKGDPAKQDQNGKDLLVPKDRPPTRNN